MDRNEFNLRVDQMRKQASLGDYATAMKIADGIDWRRVPNVSLLSQVSEIYEKNREYGEAKEILLLAFERAPMGKGLLYKLTQLALKDRNVEEADAYYREFCDLARDDTRQYILQYQILKEKKASAAQLIQPLEQYNAREIDEEWLYELAEAYHAAGRSEDCIAACDRIMLLFGTGPFVEKAAKLKQDGEGAKLTSYQQSLIDHSEIYEERLEKVKEEFAAAPEPEEEPEVNAGDILMEAPAEEEIPAVLPAADAEPGTEPEEAAAEAAPESVEVPAAEEAAAPAASAAAAVTAPAAAPEQGKTDAASGIVKEEKPVLQVAVPSFVASDVLAGFVDEGAKPAIQDEIDAEIEAHMLKLEEERDASRKAAQEVINAQKAEAERIAAEKAEAERLAAEKAEAERIAAEQAEAERLAAEKAEAERIAAEKAEAERIAAEKAEAERLAAEKAEAERLAAEKAEAERLAAEKAEAEHVAREKEEASRVEEAMQAAIAAEKERIAAENAAREQAEAKRIEEAAKAAVQAEKERIEKERIEKESIEKEKQEQEAAYIPQPKAVEELAITKVLPKIGKVKAEEGRAQVQVQVQPQPVPVKPVFRKPGDGSAIIEGKTSEEALAEAVARIKVVRKATGITNPAAKIKAEKLNRRGLAEAMKKVDGKDLIIEEAGDLSEESVNELIRVMASEDGSRTIILADNPLQIGRLKSMYPGLAEAFHTDIKAAPAKDVKKTRPAAAPENTPAAPVKSAAPAEAKPAAETRPAVKPAAKPAVKTAKEAKPAVKPATEVKPAGKAAPEEKPEIKPAAKPAGRAYSEEELDIDAFARYASDYAKKIDCVITGKSMLALYERIEIMQEDGVALTRQNAEALIEEAADRAEKPPLMKRIGGIFSKKYDKDGMLILKEDDFIL